jgi:hypothetical protein
MKKILIATNVVFLTAAIFFGCNPEDKRVPAECDHCTNYTNQKFEGIPAGLGYQMISNYKTNHWDTYRIPGQLNPTDARSVWFSLDSVKKFIWNLEQEVCNNNCVDKKDLGLRFYYGEYPKVADWNLLDGQTDLAIQQHKIEYQYLHTAVIMPTYLSTDSNMNVDFDPRFINFNTEKGKCGPLAIQDVFTKLKVEFDSSRMASGGGLPGFMLSPDVRSSAKNKGSLIPPPPPFTGNFIGEGKGAVIFDVMQNRLFTY